MPTRLHYILPLVFILLAMPSAEAGADWQRDWQRTIGEWRVSNLSTPNGETMTLASSPWAAQKYSELTFVCDSVKGTCGWMLLAPIACTPDKIYAMHVSGRIDWTVSAICVGTTASTHPKYLYRFPNLKMFDFLGTASYPIRWLTITARMDSQAPLVVTFSLDGAADAISTAIETIAPAMARNGH
jgi:hypothetical protein